MKHVPEEDLAVLAPGEEPGGAVAEHLASCSDCRARLDSFQSTVALVTSAERLPERSDAYGRDVWAALSPRLEPPPASSWRAFLAPRRLAFAGVFALVLVATFLAGRFWSVGQPDPMRSNAAVRERVLVIALGEHLERSQAILIELANAPGGDALDVSTERARASELVAANRLYRQSASRDGDRGVSAVLEELERVLLDVAHGPSQLTSEDLSALRSRIEEQGVLFKIRVIGSTLRERGELPVAEALERKRT
ncbi:MAG TPA: hypothetical protein VFF17_03300 [Thermoanaerobaculia bacterium]|nr:hypothetical protein [Thermoanaerobaculia bacterium]